MTLHAVLIDLAERGIELRADGDRVLYHPAEIVGPGLRALLVTFKAELLGLLAAGPTTAAALAAAGLPEPWGVWFEERAATREYDGGQTREHAEREAWREMLAAMERTNGANWHV